MEFKVSQVNPMSGVVTTLRPARERESAAWCVRLRQYEPYLKSSLSVPLLGLPSRLGPIRTAARPVVDLII